jgi:PAS domain S-box-containing protein
MRFALAPGKLSLLVLLATLAALFSTVASAAEPPKKVLIFSGVDPNLPGVVILNQTIRATLEKGTPGRLAFYSEALDNSRIPNEKYEQEMIRYLQRKYEGENFDLIIVLSSAGVKFLLKHKDEIFSDTPKIFVNTTDHELDGVDLGQQVTGVQGRIELKPALDLALSLHPGTRRVVVVTGTANQDRFWERAARDQFQSYEDKLEFTYQTSVTIEELRKELASLPPNTIVFFLNFLLDRAGDAYSTPEAVSLAAPSSSAPVYVMLQTAIRPGVVGGLLVSYEALGTAASELGLRVLAGEKPASIKPQTIPSVPMFDWRELRRWGIDETKLPAGSIVLHKEFSVWELYKWRIVGVVVLCILEAILIVYLLIVRNRRRRAEEAKDKFAAIVESSDDAILSVTLEGTITSWNAGAERMNGYVASEIVGQHITTLALGDRKKESEEILGQIQRGESVDHLETVRVTKDGRPIDVSLSISPIRDAHGSIIGASTIARDITARKRAQAEALKHRAELTHLSRVTMLGELSGSLAHELNQPLTAILSNAQAAQRFLTHDNVDLEEVRDILGDIVDQDKRAGEVIHRLRLLLKKGEVEQQPLNVNNVVEEVLKLIRGDLANHGVTTLAKLAPDLPTVKGDRVQLQQVLLNLVMNACDAMDGNASSDRQIVVSTELADGAGICFSVSDSGPGMTGGDLEQVFEPFFTSKVHGLGLGLSVCRSIIAAHGGKLWAVNNPEKGATFRFTLPVRTEMSDAGC